MAIRLDIYRGNNILLSDVPITETATHKATLMKEDYIKLSFYASENYSFKSGDYIRISFKDGEYSQDTKGVIYALGSDYFPTMDNEAVYKYELQFNACWYNLSQYQFLFLTETPNREATYVTRRESEWNFTGTASELAALIIKNTRLLGLYNANFTLVSTRSCPCKLDSIFYCEPTEVKSFSFSSTDIISALNQIAKEFELEWWIEYVYGVYRLHIGECDNSIIYESDNTTKFNPDGSRAKDETKVLPLIMGKNVTKPTVKLNSDIKRYFFVYGSSRNIDQTVTDLDVNAIATKRLSLNNPIDKGVGSGEAVLIFDDIYPKSDYQITRVDSYETQSDTIIGYESNGNPKYLTYTIYQIYVKAFSDMVMETIASDADVQNIEDMVASGKKLSVKFITHTATSTTITPLLAGWEFEVGAVLKMDSTGKSWYELQIIHQEINDFIVPNANLRPAGKESGTATDLKGNKTTIAGVGDNADWICVFNIKGAYIKPEQSASAKQELQKAFDKYYANLKKNVSYTIAPYSDSKIFVNLGDAINLQYGDNQVVTRVNGFTRHLDYPIDASYELCSYTNTGAVNSLKDDVKVLNAVVNRMSGGGSVDANVVTDLINAFGKKHFLSKDTEDTAAKRITFNGGLTSDLVKSTTYTSGFGGKGYEIKMEDKSQLTIDKAVIRDDVKIGGDAAISGSASVGGQLTANNITSSDYNGEFTGFTLKDTEGGSYLEVDKLNVRKKAVFRELDIKKIDHIGGANVTSPASCKIDAVDLNFPAVDLIDANGKLFYAADGEFLVLSDIADGYKCYFNATDGDKTIHNEWKVGDQALCHAFNLTTPRYYWRLVTAVSVEPIDGFHCVVLSMSDCDTDSDVPMAEDTIVCFGNRTDKDRQSVIIMDSEGASAPYLRQLKGINSYNISDANIVTQLSPTKNIIRGETIELSTSSGNKGVQDLANDALKNAKKYTDTAFGDAKKYTDTSLGSAKEYADGVLGSAKEYADGIKELANSYTDSALGSAKEYADGVGTSALNAAKTYADGVGATAESNAKTYADGVANTAETNAKGYADGVGSTVKGYADGLFADAENYTQEREAYLQSQITANANGIGLCATKTELQSVSDGVNTLATRVTSAEASIKVNADGITALANKTEVDITALGNRISSAEASIQVNAGQIALKANQTDLETVKNSVNGLTTRMTSAETKITQNANAIKLKASKDDLTAVSNAVGGLETRMTAAESSLTVQADRISSVVSEYEGLVKQYGFADFTIKCGWLSGAWITNAQGNNIGSPLGYEKDTACQLMILTDVEKGDAIRVVPKAKTQQAVVQIYGCDGDAQGAEQDAFNLIGEDVANYTWYGRSTTLVNNFDIDKDGSAEYAVPVDCREVHIWLSDDWSEKANIQVFHIKAKISAQSRIDQTADNIRLQVGEAGINLDSKVITLDASKTIVTGDLAVSVVKTYWDAAQTQIKSAYNGNGEGTIVYYYPNGRIMKEDKFVSDTSGNIVGMRTTYYKANGEVAWVIDEGGFLTTLPDYWEVLNNGNKMCYSTDESAMMDILTQYLGESMQYFTKDKFSRFVSNSGNYKNYNGKVSKAVRSSENPTTSMLWAGILIYSVELYKDGVRPTYIVTYEVCTTALGQVGAIVTKKFNSLGEIS